jgi:hypothetical protein
VGSELIELGFCENQLNTEDEYAITLYSDPTLRDGLCQHLKDDEDHKVFLCSNQYDLLSQIPNHVLTVRTSEIGVISFYFQKGGGRARCSFKHANIYIYNNRIVWSVKLESFEFDARCYFGPNVCTKASQIPAEQRVWKGEEGMCKPTQCLVENCQQELFCETHDSEHPKIHLI